MRALRWRPSLLALLALTAGCTGEPPPEGPGPEELSRLHSLPYAGSAPKELDAPSGVVFHDPRRSHPGATLYTVQALSLAELIEPAGQVVRSWHLPGSERWERAELLPGGDLLVIGADRPAEPVNGIPDGARYLARLDWNGELRWKRRLPAHHDVEPQPDGRLLLLTFKRRRIARFDPRIDVRDDQISLLDAEGRVLEELSLLEAFEKSPELHELAVFGPNTLGVVPWVDLFHANSVERVRRPDLAGRHPIFEPGNILLSSRHQNIVAVVSWERRRLVWAWGRGELRGPHDARLLDNGHILIFDNGTGRGWSRVVELDPVAGAVVWEYRASPAQAFYTATKGSSQRLANGNTLIADSDHGRAFEVTREGEVVWDFLCPHELGPRQRAAIVRAVRYEPSFIDAQGLGRR